MSTKIVIVTTGGSLAESLRESLQTAGCDVEILSVYDISMTELTQRIMEGLGPSTTLRVGDVVLDPDTRRVFRGEQEIKLSFNEFQLLKFLMRTPGHVRSREELLNYVWGRNVLIRERTVDKHISTIRGKLTLGGKKRDPSAPFPDVATQLISRTEDRPALCYRAPRGIALARRAFFMQKMSECGARE